MSGKPSDDNEEEKAPTVDFSEVAKEDTPTPPAVNSSGEQADKLPDDGPVLGEEEQKPPPSQPIPPAD